ncbi:MAG: cytochrome ubiquinol oxidase subunit I [Acidobacteriota bacterium]|nr:cytochrome ubiquinol oxidase subunit I [Acidobacteriota bacterium]
MTNLLAARLQMAGSLGFHIIFAVVGMAMPLLMVLAEMRWRKTGDPLYRELAQRWAKGTAILFAVGAVSGTVLSFELGLLWPNFMAFAGPVIGLPFALEGFAFFLEAIFLGIYLYGWEKVSARMHLFAGVMVAVTGTLSGVFVTTVNAWMNTPRGFEVVDGMPVNIEPLVAMTSPAALTQCTHVVISAWQSVSWAVVAIHAFILLRRPTHHFHRRALSIALPVAVITALIQPLAGDFSAKMVAKYEPVKLAAMEGQWETEKGAPLRIGGWPDEENEVTRYSIEIPKLLSILASFDPDYEVKGLKEFPKEDRPPVAITHIAFQIMVGAGMIMAFVGLLVITRWWRAGRKLPRDRWLLRLLVWCGPLGMIAMEAGWVVTEVGRQPWVIHGIMRTSEAVTPFEGVRFTLVLFLVIYAALAYTVVQLLRRQVFASLKETSHD